MLRTISLAALVAGAALALVVTESADGCMMIAPLINGKPTRVEIAQESAIILWDAATKTEHFIRRSSFQSDTPNFGFLVPTPTQPELAEADNKSFPLLEKVTAPKIVLVPAPRGGAFGGGLGGGAAPGGPPPVEVLELKRVAGFDAAVLEARDADALNKWLKDNGYQSSPHVARWLEPYIANKWIITAFKIATKEPGAKAIHTSALRMSFKTEKPFYPYREPATQRDPDTAPRGDRLLRVYFIGDKRVGGVVGESGAFPGTTVWSNKMTDADRTKLLALLKVEAGVPAGPWHLTEFEDRSSPRPGTDELYFAASNNQSTVTRPPVTRFVNPKLPVRPLPAPIAPVQP